MTSEEIARGFAALMYLSFVGWLYGRSFIGHASPSAHYWRTAMTPEEDQAIASAWPARWEKANDSRPGVSKRRNNLRKYWRAHLAFNTFKAANPEARCGNCRSFKPMPHDSRMQCEAESDFYGYQIATADGVCVQWRALLENSHD